MSQCYDKKTFQSHVCVTEISLLESSASEEPWSVGMTECAQHAEVKSSLHKHVIT